MAMQFFGPATNNGDREAALEVAVRNISVIENGVNKMKGINPNAANVSASLLLSAITQPAAGPSLSKESLQDAAPAASQSNNSYNP